MPNARSMAWGGGGGDGSALVLGSGIEVTDVLTYGADKTGVLDSTSAVQKAITDAQAAGRGIVYLPLGVYKITSPLTIAGNGIRLSGAHMLGTELQWYGSAGPMIDLGDNVTQWTDVMLDGFRVRDYSGSATTGIRCRKITRLRVRDVTVTATTAMTTGFDLNTILFGMFDNVRGGAQTTGFNVVGCAQLQFFGGAMVATTLGTGTGLAIDTTSNTVDLFGTDFENYSVGVSCTGDLCRFFGPRLDGVTTEFVLNSGATYCWIIGPSTSKATPSTIVVTDNSASATQTIITPGHFKVAQQAAAEFGSNIRIPNNVAIQARNAANSADLGILSLNASDQIRLPLAAKLEGNVGFYNTAPGAKPTVTGSRAANAALASLLTGLAGLGLLTDSSTA